jgi:hypothetical protein
MTDAAVVSVRELVRANRVAGFDAVSWLRGSRMAQEDAPQLDRTTRQRSPQLGGLVFEPPKLDSPKVDNFIAEQTFECVVLSVDEVARSFWARLVDCTAQNPDEEAEFAFSEIPIDDWPLIMPGALFFWNVGREWRDGQMRRVSDIRFRRFFQFSGATVSNARQRASELAELIAEANAYPPGDTADI